MRNLIICSTVLQSYIAEKIIEHECLVKKNIELIYLTHTNNEINKNYYNRLKKKVGFSTYIHVDKKAIFFINIFRRKLRQKKYDTVYLANVDSYLNYFILSKISFNKLVTFDDGVGNINEKSNFYIDNKSFKRFLQKIVYFTMGNKYNLIKIKNIISAHYTIYHGFKNISDKLIEINLISLNTSHEYDRKKSKCIVILGTVYSELTINNREQLICQLQNFININSCQNIVYIPHPRDDTIFTGVKVDNRPLLGEQKICALLNKYKNIELYGFCSSIQYNFLDLDGLKNYYFNSSIIDKRYKAYTELSNSCGLNLYELTS